MLLSNSLALEVTTFLSGGCYSFRWKCQQSWCWWPHLHTKQLAHDLVSTDLLHIGYGTGRCYNMDEIGLFYCAQLYKKISARKSFWVPSHSCSCRKHNKHRQVQISKPNIWELDDEPQCTFQILKVEGTLIMNKKIATHSLKHVGMGEAFGFSTLQLSSFTLSFLPTNATNVVQPLDQGIIASFKIKC